MLTDLTQLNCFVTVAEELHFGKAAERLCMTQPPLTRQIQALEEALGVKLFERTSRTVRLTAVGKVFLVDARRLLNMAREASTTALKASRGEAGRVTIGFTPVMGFDLIPDLIAESQQRIPEVDLVLREMTATSQLDALDNHSIDIAFLWPLTSRIHLEHEVVLRDKLVAVLRDDHPLAKKERLVLEDFNEQSFVMYSKGQARYLYGLINGMFVSNGVTPAYVQHLEQVMTIVNMVRSGIGVSIVPESITLYRIDNVVYRPLEKCNVQTEGRMAWRSDHHNPAMVTFLQFASSFLKSRRGNSLVKSI